MVARLEKILAHLPNDPNASFYELFVNQKPLQHLLREEYRDSFSEGRFKETFVPIFSSECRDRSVTKIVTITASKESSVSLVPIYGCLDGCCAYVYARAERTNSCVTWTGVGRNSAFLPSSTTTKHEIMWLANFRPLEFKESVYRGIFGDFHFPAN